VTQQTINLGAAPNDGTGDPQRTAFDKCNTNFTELYGAVRTAANPTAEVGTTPVNGALSSAFMRADAAPAISLTMMPTWTGLHTFNGGVALNTLHFSTVPTEYADDAAAATGGVPVGGVYKTGSVLKVRAA
jgi:hypothetical protein